MPGAVIDWRNVPDSDCDKARAVLDYLRCSVMDYDYLVRTVAALVATEREQSVREPDPMPDKDDITRGLELVRLARVHNAAGQRVADWVIAESGRGLGVHDEDAPGWQAFADAVDALDLAIGECGE